MAGFLEDIKYEVESLSSATPEIDYLYANIFQKVTMTATVRYETYVNAETDEGFSFDDPQDPDDSWVRDEEGLNRFEEFSVGDTIIIQNANTLANDGEYLVMEKPDDNRMRMWDTSGAGAYATFTQDLSDETVEFRLQQDPEGLVYDYGLIRNNEATNYFSKVDGSIMRFVSEDATSAPLVGAAMIPLGKKDWQFGYDGGASFTNQTETDERNNEIYVFQIVHTFYVHPFYLPPQITELQNNVAPTYFRSLNALTNVWRLEARREAKDPNVFQEFVYDGVNSKDGNSGWFDEEGNGGNPEYEVTNLSYNNTINTLDLAGTTNVTFDIEKLVVGANDPEYVCVNFIVLPEQESDIANNNLLMRENYCWDRALQEQGAAAIDGEAKAADATYTVIEDLTVTVSAGVASVDFDVNFGSAVLNKFDGLTNKQFLIAAYVVDNFATPELNNYVTLLVDVNTATTEIGTGTATVTTDFLFADQTDNSFVNPNDDVIKVEDEVVADTLVLLDQGTLSDAQLEGLTAQIVATDGTDEAVLFERTYDSSADPLSGAVRTFRQATPSGFISASTELLSELIFYRSTADDTGTQYGYRIQFPFLMRWEYWEQLILSNIPGAFIDYTEPNNGVNQDWIRLAGLSGFDLVYRVIAEVSASGVTSALSTDVTLDPKDYDHNANWGSNSIVISDTTGSLSVGGQPYMKRVGDTTVTAIFVYSGGGSPTAADVYAVMRIIPKENGTWTANESLSSEFNREARSNVLKSTLTTGLLDIQESGGTFTVSAKIDASNIDPAITEYTISCSIAEKNTSGTPDRGNVIVQDCFVQDVIDFDPPVTPKDENPLRKCCFEHCVLASTTDADDLKNDYSLFLEIIPQQYTCSMDLEKLVDGTWTKQADLNTNAYGTYYTQGFESRDNNEYIAYVLEWRDVLSAFDAGKYRVKFDFGGGDALYSDSYCLDEFTTARADGSTRITYTLDSRIGDADQTKVRDFSGLNLTGQLRICQSYFGFASGSYEEEVVRWTNGFENIVSLNLKNQYTLEMQASDTAIRDFLKYTVFFADEMTITDYNSKNADDYVELPVRITGEFAPNYEGSRPYPSIIITLAQAYDNNRKLYS
jgi:hypothetical protein